MEPQLSKQVFNMLSGSSSLPGKHVHTLAHRHKARQDGTGFGLCGMAEEIETAREWFQLEDKSNRTALLPLSGCFPVFLKTRLKSAHKLISLGRLATGFGIAVL